MFAKCHIFSRLIIFYLPGTASFIFVKMVFLQILFASNPVLLYTVSYWQPEHLFPGLGNLQQKLSPECVTVKNESSVLTCGTQGLYLNKNAFTLSLFGTL